MSETLLELGKNPLIADETWAAMIELRRRALSDNGRREVDPSTLDKSMKPFRRASRLEIRPTVDVLLPEGEGGSHIKMELVAVGLDGTPIDSNSRVSLGDLLKELESDLSYRSPVIPSDSAINFEAAVAIAEAEIRERYEQAQGILRIAGLELDDLRWPVFS